jgi:hypothetical protein
VANRSYSINHNKLFTFSATGNLTDVSVIGSHNLTNSQNANHNNLLVVHQEPDLYQHFVRYLGDLLAQRKNNNYYASANGYYRSPTSDARVFHSPRADSSGGTGVDAGTDLVVGRLSYITRYEAGCSVEVAHAQFTGPRVAVADELIRIARLGCQVRIVGGSGMTDYIRTHLAGRSNVTVRRLDSLHSKYIVYRGNYNGSPGRQMVFTGSQNLTGPALRNHDETLIRVEGADIAGSYRADLGGASGRGEAGDLIGEELRIDRRELLPFCRDVILGEDGRHRAHRLAGRAVHALVGLDVEHPPALVDAIYRTLVHAGPVLHVDAGLCYDVSHQTGFPPFLPC